MPLLADLIGFLNPAFELVVEFVLGVYVSEVQG
jgi:hypothetical protein